MEAYSIIKVRKGKKYFFRSTVNQRLQHIILATCVIILVLTGMPLKFHDTSWAPTMPNIIVEKQDMLNVIAYILDLKGRDEPKN